MSDKYYFCGNLPELTLQSDTSAEFTLRGVDVLITEKYSPDKSGRIKVSLKDIVKDILPPLNMMATQQAIRRYGWELGDKSGSFRVIPGGHAALDGIPADGFLANNFLTWQPQSCLTTHSAPQWLTYVAQTSSYCYLKGYFSDGSTQQVQLRAILPSIIHSFDVSYATVCSVLGKNPTYYDVVVDDGTNKTYTQRYILRNSTPDDDVFIFENSLGGCDTIILSGGKEYIDEIESQASIFGEETLEYDVKANRTCKKYTGYITNNHTRLWTLDFFNSINRYHVDEGAIYRIVITKPTLKATSGELAGYDFIFARAKQNRFLNLPRIENPELLEIVDPTDNLFF